MADKAVCVRKETMVFRQPLMVVVLSVDMSVSPLIANQCVGRSSCVLRKEKETECQLSNSVIEA